MSFLLALRHQALPVLSSRSLTRALTLAIATLPAITLAGCGGGTTATAPPVVVTPTPTPAPPPAVVIPTMAPTFTLTGDTTLVHDPSIVYQAGVYYSLSTDSGDQAGKPQVGYIPIRSSTDKLAWSRVGQVFDTVPQFVQNYFAPSTFKVFWAPDVSFFNGLYHVYYAASGFGLNKSLIGLATSPTMNPNDAAYKWTDRGVVLSSTTSSNFNAIDPSLFVDTNAAGAVSHIWITYGSFWNGIFQQEIDPATGLLLNPGTTPGTYAAAVNLATRPGVTNNPIEGPNLVKRNGFYYLFTAFDYCCSTPASGSNYKIAVGRATSPQGPFLDQSGVSMLQGGGTIVLQSGTNWTAPGGSTVLIDPVRGDIITYHALSVASNYLDYLFVDTITWPNDWPVITQ